MFNENIKMVEKIKDHEIYSEVKKLLTENNYDEAISKLKISLNEIDDQNKKQTQKKRPTNLKINHL